MRAAGPSKPNHTAHQTPSSALFLLGVLSLLLAACQAPPTLHREQFYVFGTLVEISIFNAEPNQADTAIKDLAQQFQHFHNDWHAWQPSGALHTINQAFARGETVPLQDPLLRELILKSQDLAQRSQHLFNPCIGQLSALWGFQRDDFTIGALPSQAEITRLIAANPNMNDVHVDADTIRSDNPAVSLDFGAIAKGYAVDWAITILRQHGITNAIVNAGGNLRAIGQHDERPWRIGIRHPSGTGVLAALDINQDESVFTSGNYERYREIAGHRYSHILDPRTGWPVEDMVSVTVIHDNGTEADVASTALSVAGLTAWRDIASQLGIQRIMLVDAQGTVYLTPAMQSRLEFITTPNIVILATPAIMH